MCEELMNLMKPEFDEAMAKATAEGLAAGHAEGLAIGRAEERLARLADALSLGFSMEQITELFHPTEEEMEIAGKRAAVQ